MKGNMKTNEQLRRGSGNGRSNAMPSANITESAAKKTRILIVEDEPAMVEGLRDNFEYEGYDVISAGDGVAGLDRALADDPDLVVLADPARIGQVMVNLITNAGKYGSDGDTVVLSAACEGRAVRVSIHAERSRCSPATACCSGRLTGMGRIASLR